MQVKVEFDATRFNNELKKRVARSKEALPKVINRTSLDVAMEAYKAVKKADRAKIESLGIIGYQIRKKASKKTGSLKLSSPKAIYSATGRMGAIIASRMRKDGQDPTRLAAGEMEKRVKAAISSRIRAIGFMAVSFVPIIRRLSSLVGSAKSTFDAKQKGKPKGSVKPAREGWVSLCEFGVSSGLSGMKNQSAKAKAQAESILSSAMAKGFSAKADDMERHAIKALNKALSR